MSPDPLGGNPANPESLDRHAYAVNNPETLNDPSGRYPLYPIEAPCEMGSGYDCDPSEGLGGWGDPFQLAFGGGESCAGGDCESWWGVDQSALDVYLLLLEDDLESGDTEPSGVPQTTCSKQASAFVSANSAYANQIAKQSGISATNLLGLSALESDFGESNLASNYNNYFGLTAGSAFKGTMGVYTTPAGRSFGIYPSPGFLTSGLSFAQSFQGRRVTGVTDPATFAQRLTTPPLAFNSEAGYAGKLILRINQVGACW